MTESLKSFLSEQAGSVAFRPPNLEAIARDNSRRVWRRRAGTALASVAVIAVIASAALVWTNRKPDVTVNPVPSEAGYWATGTTIYNGADTIEVGHRLRAFVPTSVGFVTIDHAHNVYSVTSQGIAKIGEAMFVPADGTGYMRLFSDPRGSLAGWVAWEDSSPVMRVHDQATGKTNTYRTGGGTFFAIDDRTAYWSVVTRGIFAVDLDTGVETQLASAAEAANLQVYSVENGVLAFSKKDQPGGPGASVSVGRSFGDARQFTFGHNAEGDDSRRLSPTGAWLAYLFVQFDGPPAHDKPLAIEAHVRDTVTGELIPLKIPLQGFVIPVGWLSDTTLQVLAIGAPTGQTSGQANMYTCRVPDGSCVSAAELPLSAVDGSNLVLPTGEWIGEE